MLFCCLRRNVEASCREHFVVISRHQQAPPLTTSDNCLNFPRFGGAVLITPIRSQRWQHAMKPDIGSESRFVPTPPAFDTPIRGVPPSSSCLVWKKLEWWVYPTVKHFEDMFIRFDRIHERDRVTYTDGQTYTVWRHRPRLCIASRGKNY